VPCSSGNLPPPGHLLEPTLTTLFDRWAYSKQLPLQNFSVIFDGDKIQDYVIFIAKLLESTPAASAHRNRYLRIFRRATSRPVRRFQADIG
jgi:hypothetical protein